MKTGSPTIALLALFAVHCTGGQGTNSNPTLNAPPPDVASTAVEDVAPPSEPDAALTEPVSTPDVIEQDVPPTPVADASATPDASRADAGRATTRPPTGTTRPPTGTTSTSSTAAADALADARAVFDRSCGRCHPGGNNRIGPRLTGRNDSEAHTRQVVRNGDGTMRPIPTSRLSDGDLAKVIVFLRSIRAVR
ncbi:MAG: cytochrome c [Myxococcales bacterium]|nr:cytochrome c [Myxococcales bacterium]